MARTYTDTPEPRYVERAKESETTSALPEIKNTDRGKFLKVKANKNELMYDSIPNEVPTPAVADAGKVLGVNDQGKYALVEGSGASGLLITATWREDNSCILDKNYNEIKAALDSGINPLVTFVITPSPDTTQNWYYHIDRVAILGMADVTYYEVVVSNYYDTTSYQFSATSPTGVLTYTGGD